MQLDGGLPDPLCSVGMWLHQAEKILQEDLLLQQSHEETANAIHRTRQLHQVDEKSQRGVDGGEGNEEWSIQGVTVMNVCHFVYPQEILCLVETHQQTFQRFHRDRSVGGVPVPAEQLQDMAERCENERRVTNRAVISARHHICILALFCLRKPQTGSDLNAPF